MADDSRPRASALTSGQHRQLRDALADMPAGPTSAFWQRFATGRPELARAGPSATFRLAALLLETCECDVAALESTLHDIERRLAPARGPAI